MLGRFLEISVHSDRVLESLQFYEALGFRQIAVGETWSYPYAVITDGRLFLGLHQQKLASPTLTFVRTDLSERVEDLRLLDIDFDYERLGDDEFNEVGFHDPGGVSLRLIEARTFSPPQIEPGFSSTCGYFMELGLYTAELKPARAFWERLGFIAMDEEPLPFARVPVTGDHFNIGLHRSRALRQPALIFEDANMPERLARLKERGFSFTDEMPDALDSRANAVLIAPEGTRLLLTQAVET